jgi:hypothetical protein
MISNDEWQKRILDIRARIAYLRSCVEGSERSNYTSKAQQRTLHRSTTMERSPQDVGKSARNKELDSIKAKLRKKS